MDGKRREAAAAETMVAKKLASLKLSKEDQLVAYGFFQCLQALEERPASYSGASRAQAE